MAEIPSFVSQLHSSQPEFKAAPVYSNPHTDPYPASDDEIPTVDYSLLFSDDHFHRSLALEYLRHACQEYGFFYVNFLSSTILYLSG